MEAIMIEVYLKQDQVDDEFVHLYLIRRIRKNITFYISTIHIDTIDDIFGVEVVDTLNNYGSCEAELEGRRSRTT
jgi:hypothetical protein